MIASHALLRHRRNAETFQKLAPVVPFRPVAPYLAATACQNETDRLRDRSSSNRISHALAPSSNVKKIKCLSRGIPVPNAGVFRQIFIVADKPGAEKPRRRMIFQYRSFEADRQHARRRLSLGLRGRLGLVTMSFLETWRPEPFHRPTLNFV